MEQQRPCQNEFDRPEILHRKRRGRITFWTTVFLGLVVSLPSYSAEEIHRPLSKGATEFGISSGYGWSFDSPESVNTIPINIHWGYVFTDPSGPMWFWGTLELVLEGSFNYLCNNRNQYGIGAHGMLRYNLLTGTSFVPFVQGGIGLWHSNVDIGGFPNDFNFSPQAGAGIQYFLQRSLSIRAEYRVQHFSNAGTKDKNPGLNFHNVLIGLSWHY